MLLNLSIMNKRDKITIMNRLLTFITIAILLSGCSEQKSPAQNSSNPDSISLPDSEVSRAVIYLYDREMTTTKIIADKLLKFDSVDSTAIYRVDVNIFDSSGAVTTEIVGDSGIIKERIGFLELFGNVVVKTGDDRMLETEHLFWNSKKKLIQSDLFVKITQGENVVTGIGLEADQNLISIKILENAEGEIRNSEEISGNL